MAMDFLKNLGSMGQIMSLASQLPKIREEMQRVQESLQQRAASLVAEGDAGAGMVKVRINGKQEVIACEISEEAMRLGDAEMLGELVRGASNQALERVRQLLAQVASEEYSNMTNRLGLPPGMGLPGMGLPGM